MAKSLVGALALALLPSAFAFRDTSPFFLFSTADLNINGNDATIAQSSKITGRLVEALQDCPSKTYFVVRQEGVSSNDYFDDVSAPRLGHYMKGGHAEVKSTMAISETVGSVDAHWITQHLQSKCGAEALQVDPSSPKVLPRSEYPVEQLVVYVTLPTPPAQNRAAVLDGHDSSLENLIFGFRSSDYTVIYTTTARVEEEADATLQDQHTYEMENPFGEAMHMELKRDTVAHQNKRVSAKEGGLFERYQYFSPGLFMGIIAIIPLAIILYVGLTAITSLEVSYFAFSKEMGPAAQRKQ